MLSSLVAGNSITSAPNQKIFSSTEPKKSGKIGKFTKHSGRRLSSAPTPQQQQQKEQNDRAQARAKLANGNASIEELDKILEDDALALLNIKKEIHVTQHEELKKIQNNLVVMRKEYDSIFQRNNHVEKELQNLQDRYLSLSGVDQATSTTVDQAKTAMNELSDQTTSVLDDLAAEQRTIKMQTLMIKRLDEEIGKCRLDTAKATVNVEHAKHDLSLAENSMAVNRQYLLEQELQLEKLQTTLKLRKDQRDNKIHMLHSLSLEGENSVAKLQQSLVETSRKSPLTGRSMRHQSTNKAAGNKTNKDIDDEELADLPEIVARARRMNINQIKEAVQRYTSQTARMERLQQQDAELKNNVFLQLKKKQELSDHLNQTQIKIQQLASSRQMYQEVDLTNTALANASKEFEEAKEKDFRLKLGIESLKQSIPRFLTKVTRNSHMKPNENQLADAASKLEDEVTKLIKVIGSALLKDATPDDLALMSQQTASAADSNSEFGRLQRLPGFTRMQRQLFFNMMTARQDLSGNNIRTAGGERGGGGKGGKDGKGGSNKMLRAQKSESTIEDEETMRSTMQDLENGDEPALGRDTIKSISRLIVDRDGLKFKASMEKN